MALTARLDLKPLIQLTSPFEIAGQTISSVAAAAITLANLTAGTGLNKCDLVYIDTRTLAGAATENLNMYSLLNPFGAAQVWATVKALAIILTTATVGSKLKVGGEGSAAAWMHLFDASDTGKVVIGPGGSIIVCDPSALGMAVANTTSHLLKIENVSSPSISHDYVVIAVGASAQA